MKLSITTVVILGWLCTLPGQAQLAAQPEANMSRGEARKIQREADTPARLKTLAGYYRQREEKFDAKAADEKSEWERRRQSTYSLNAKPPRPADSAQNLYEYYRYESDQAAKLAEQYEKNAETRAALDEQPPSK